MLPDAADYLIIGGGVLGLSVALEIRRRNAAARIVILEKEPTFGVHASGRNSGVLHAGFYYTADSLKAKFCRTGNAAMHRYCEEKQLPLNRCGKLVVTRDESELEGLKTLYERGRKNDVELELISEQQAKKIEPGAKTCQQALFSPTTSTVAPARVVQALVQDARGAGIGLCQETAYVSQKDNVVTTTKGAIGAQYVINAAGLYADTIARDFGFAQDYAILPFKGLYLYAEDSVNKLKTHIYPVPNLKFPFLGVHVTITVDGKVKIGPTAIPAFWRENYGGLQNFKLREMLEIMGREIRLLTANDFGFTRLAVTEIRKYYKPYLAHTATALAEDISVSQFKKWGQPGIRAQLYHKPSGKLEMDFCYQGDARSFHLLNAVSPAFTCAFPFSAHIVDEMQRLRAAGGE